MKISGPCERCGRTSSLSEKYLCPKCIATPFSCVSCSTILEDKTHHLCSMCAVRAGTYLKIIGVLIFFIGGLAYLFSLQEAIQHWVYVGVCAGVGVYLGVFLTTMVTSIYFEIYKVFKPVKKAKIRELVYSYREAPERHNDEDHRS